MLIEIVVTYLIIGVMVEIGLIVARHSYNHSAEGAIDKIALALILITGVVWPYVVYREIAVWRQGVRCGWCGEKFDTVENLKQHALMCGASPIVTEMRAWKQRALEAEQFESIIAKAQE